MGPLLQVEVETQLLQDLRHYGVTGDDLIFDWRDSCQEGHCTSALDGNLEELSSVTITDSRFVPIAEGWMDFIHGGENRPLFVFWLFLSVMRDGEWVKVKDTSAIPEHVWGNLPEETKRLCATLSGYDSRWSSDPKAIQWARRQ